MTADRVKAAEALTSASASRQAYREALADLVNITSQFDDLNREDHVFLTPSGYRVKVKVLLDEDGEMRTSAPGMFHLSGSIVGPDGKALRRDDDTPAVWAQGMTWSHHSHQFMHPSQALDLALRRCALETVTAELHRDIIHGDLGGFDTRASFEARKAAEAADADV